MSDPNINTCPRCASKDILDYYSPLNGCPYIIKCKNCGEMVTAESKTKALDEWNAKIVGDDIN